MHIAAIGKSPQQGRVARQVSHDAQLDLRIVGRHQHMSGRRDEGLTDAPALGRAYRYVLQIGVAGRQPPGSSHRLVIAGVDAAGVGVDLLRQLVGVSGLELGQAPVVEDEPRQFVLGGQLFEYVFGGRGLAGGSFAQHRYLQTLEQDLLQLLG